MKVKVLESFSGIHGGFKFNDLVELDEQIAEPYIAVGFLQRVDDEAVETVAIKKPRKTRMTKATPLSVEAVANDIF